MLIDLELAGAQQLDAGEVVRDLSVDSLKNFCPLSLFWWFCPNEYVHIFIAGALLLILIASFLPKCSSKGQFWSCLNSLGLPLHDLLAGDNMHSVLKSWKHPAAAVGVLSIITKVVHEQQQQVLLMKRQLLVSCFIAHVLFCIYCSTSAQRHGFIVFISILLETK